MMVLVPYITHDSARDDRRTSDDDHDPQTRTAGDAAQRGCRHREDVYNFAKTEGQNSTKSSSSCWLWSCGLTESPEEQGALTLVETELSAF